MARTITITSNTLEAALNCLEACGHDEAEPQRYRDWYQEAFDELSATLDNDSHEGKA